MAGAGGNLIGGCSSAASVPLPPPGSTDSSCPNPASVPPVITSMQNQIVPSIGNITVFFTVSGSVIPNALVVTATSSDTTLVPPAAMVVSPPGLGGETSVRITPTPGTSGPVTITVSVRDPGTSCITSTSFVLSVGVASVPTLTQWAQIALAMSLMVAGYLALQRRRA
jgi:hypothetical protein